jgi:hypothetical protein
VDRNPFEPLARETTKHLPELTGVADRMDAAHGGGFEGLEQSPPAGANRESPRVQIRLELTEHELGELLPRAFQVEDELCVLGCGREEIAQGEARAPPASELPAIPQNRDRPRRL